MSCVLTSFSDTRVSTGHGRDRVPEQRLANRPAVLEHASRVFKQPCLEIRVKSTPVIGNTHRWNRLELTRASQSLFRRIVVNIPVRFGQGWKMGNKRHG